jgi:rhamnosyl/mannosyltransferase
MNILQLNKYYFPEIGGIERVVQDIAEQDPQSVMPGINSEVLTCRKKGGSITETINGVKVKRSLSFGTLFSLPIAPLYPIETVFALKNADAVILHEPFPLGDIGLLLSGFKGKTALFWHSDIVRQKKLKALLMPLIRRTLKRADIIFAATENLVQSSPLLSEYRDKCVIVPFGVNIEKIRPAGNFLTDKLRDKANKKALFAGRLVYYKGIDVLIKAFCGVKGAELFIAGSGVLETEMKEFVHRENAGQKIHFLGALSDEELNKAFSDCDYFVFPSVANSEAFGIVQIEAMSQGKPVINTNLPTGVPFVSPDGISGITVEPNNPADLRAAMQKLTDDKELRERLGIGARERAVSLFDKKIFREKIFETIMK